jgi:hypothetical protein
VFLEGPDVAESKWKDSAGRATRTLGGYGFEEACRTDSGGQFWFRDLSPGSYQLSLDAPAYLATRKVVEIPRGATAATAAFRLPRGRDLLVRLQSASGTPIRGRVSAYPGRKQRSVPTGCEGEALLRGLPLTNLWLKVQPAHGYLEPEPIEVEAEVEEIVVVLERGSSIEGHVLSMAGEPLADMEIHAIDWTSGGTLAKGFTGEGGEFALGVPEGAVADILVPGAKRKCPLCIGPLEWTPYRGERRAVSAPSSGLEIRSRQATDPSLTVTVLDDAGLPVPSARVVVRCRSGTVAEAPPPDPYGRRVFLGLPEEEIEVRILRGSPFSPRPARAPATTTSPPESLRLVPRGQEILLRCER